MMTQKEIDASIAALEPAPAGETLEQIAVRGVHWLLGTIEDEHPEIAVTHSLYARAIAGDRPTEDEWQSNIDALDRARDLALALALAVALDLDLDLARARDLALALDLDLDLTLARARALPRDLDLARARDLALALALTLARARALPRDLALPRALQKLLGDRLHPVERLDAAILAAVGVKDNAFEMGSWHCGTTHCRGGWAITLHPMGAELEQAFGPWLAAAVIYLASTRRVPDFFASNKDALADIKRCAA